MGRGRQMRNPTGDVQMENTCRSAIWTAAGPHSKWGATPYGLGRSGQGFRT